nr:amidohydrolase family protein [Legionella jordanis]
MRNGLFFNVTCVSFLFSSMVFSADLAKGYLLCRDASTLFVNAKFITLNPSQPEATAVAVRHGRLVAVGEQSQILAHCRGNESQVIDLKGAFVVPGFIDTHSKFILYGWLSLQPGYEQPTTTTKQLLETLKNKLLNEEGWLIASNYNPVNVNDEALNKVLLDEHLKDKPCLVFYSSGNEVLLNQAAIEKLSSQDRAKDLKINAQGLISGKDLKRLLSLLIDKNKATLAIQEASKYYTQQGYTTVTETMVNQPWLAAYEHAAEQANSLDIIFNPDDASDKRLLEIIYQDNPRFYIGPLLMQIDGEVEDGAAFFTKPYLKSAVEPNAIWPGTLRVTKKELEDALNNSAKENTSLALEVNGDAALDLVLNAAIKTRGNAPDLLVFNAPLLRNDQLQRLQQLGIKLSWYAPYIYLHSAELCNLLNNPGALFDNLSFSSAPHLLNGISIQANSPSTPPVPLQMLSLLQNSSLSGKAQSCLKPPKLQLSPEALLGTLTINAAKAFNLQQDKGTLEVGKLADMAILNGNPLQQRGLQNLNVLGTISRGKLQWNQVPSVE